ncbi:MAG TPA: mandelate racemase/muconate lactonizing enzyme family protein [Ensifer sp.]|nr:mandelate racemase/muconate lactonizing enzyme family protein [Ensifer sp.]
MKITEIQTFLMQAGPPSLVESDPRSSVWHKTARNWLFVKIFTDAGISGVGECSGWPRVVQHAVADLAPLLVGEEAFDTERLWQKMFSAIMGHGMTGVVGTGALSGMDMALWDIKGKVLDTPVWNLLGGKMRDSVPIYAHARDVETARLMTDRGIRGVKLGGVEGLVRRVADVREAMGEGIDIMVDLAGAPWLTVSDAIALGKALEPYDLLFIEDPVAPELVDQYTRIRQHVAVPLAAGERMSTVWGMKPLIERELVDVIQPDTGRAGGLTQMKKMAAMAEAHGIMVAPHSGSLGPVAEFAALHLMASLPNALMLERVENDWPGRNRVISGPPLFENGALIVPDAPGLGVDIIEDEIAKYPSVRNIAEGSQTSREGEATYIRMRRL